MGLFRRARNYADPACPQCHGTGRYESPYGNWMQACSCHSRTIDKIAQTRAEEAHRAQLEAVYLEETRTIEDIIDLGSWPPKEP